MYGYVQHVCQNLIDHFVARFPVKDVWQELPTAKGCQFVAL